MKIVVHEICIFEHHKFAFFYIYSEINDTHINNITINYV